MTTTPATWTKEETSTFFAMLSKLAVHHRFAMDKPSAKIYWEGLRDIPIALVCESITRLLRDAGEFMPNNGRIREVVDEIQEEREEQLRANALPTPERLALEGNSQPTPVQHYFDCNVCEDTGMRPVCPGCASPNECSKHQHRYCPEFREGKISLAVSQCACVRTNPTILRRQQAAARLPRYSKSTKKYRGRTWDPND